MYMEGYKGVIMQMFYYTKGEIVQAFKSATVITGSTLFYYKKAATANYWL